MIVSGPVTAIPLLLFAAAAQRLPLVTLGLLMYLTPAMQMTWGVVVGHEPMPPARWLGFAMIWVALAIFSADALRRSQVERPSEQRHTDCRKSHTAPRFMIGLFGLLRVYANPAFLGVTLC